MDTETPSQSDVLTDCCSDSDESSNEDIDQNCDAPGEDFKDIIESVSGIEQSEGPKARDLILDLRNLDEINDSQNANEEKYEKLSEVVEEPEDIPEVASIFDNNEPPPSRPGEKCDNMNSLQLALRERISSLNNVISSLREELKTEISLWRKEREEFQILQEKSDLIALEEATAAARAAAEAYAAESPLSQDLDRSQYNRLNFIAAGEILDVNPEQTLSELTILEYEKKLAKYQDALALAQAEKRYNMRRQLAANTYRQKLMEVERLCDEELEKIKQNASSLQPLKHMVSQWYKSDRCGGDSREKSTQGLNYGCKSGPPISSEKDYSKSNFCGVSNFGNRVDAEVNMAPEIFVAKFNSLDETDFPLCKGTTSCMIETDHDRYNIASGLVNPALSLKWESSNYKLSTSLGNP